MSCQFKNYIIYLKTKGIMTKVIIAGEKYKEGNQLDTNFVHILEPPINEGGQKTDNGRSQKLFS